MKKIFNHSWKKYLAIVIVSLIFHAIFIPLNGYKFIVTYCDSFFAVGFLMICFGGLSIVSNFGAFDIFSYSGYRTVGLFQRKIPDKNVNSLYDYTNMKDEKRKEHRFEFVPYMIIGLIQIFIASLIYILLYLPKV